MTREAIHVISIRDMKIRSARDEDYAAVARLRRQTIRNVNNSDYPEDTIRNWSAKASAQDFREGADSCMRWVALDADRIIGFCEHNLAGEISRIYVHKDYLRKGVGSRLLKLAEESLKKRGYTEIRVESTVTAKEFYEKNGYKVVESAAHKEDSSLIHRMLKAL
jgi:putative acetyltransferase